MINHQSFGWRVPAGTSCCATGGIRFRRLNNPPWAFCFALRHSLARCTLLLRTLFAHNTNTLPCRPSRSSLWIHLRGGVSWGSIPRNVRSLALRCLRCKQVLHPWSAKLASLSFFVSVLYNFIQPLLPASCTSSVLHSPTSNPIVTLHSDCLPDAHFLSSLYPPSHASSQPSTHPPVKRRRARVESSTDNGQTCIPAVAQQGPKGTVHRCGDPVHYLPGDLR